MDFRAGGLPYSILVKPGKGSADITGAQAAIVERMVASIRFEPWKYGEIRDGFVSVNSYDSYPPGQVDMQLLPNGGGSSRLRPATAFPLSCSMTRRVSRGNSGRLRGR